jgi:polyphosphate glucokinase
MKPGILAIDIGGTGLKATVLNDHGHMLVDRVRVPTPHPCPPDTLLACLKEMTAALPAYDRISVGFPGVVRDGRIITAPNLDTSLWRGFDLAAAISKLHGNKPVHMLNDADMQGLALVSGHGLEFVMTLGTGVGTALFRDGQLMPHMELAHHPVHKGMTYDEYLGEAARKEVGRKRWNRRAQRAVELVDMLFNPDRIYIGGGNSARIDFKLDKHVSIGSNDAGLEGGAAVWKSAKAVSVKTAKAVSTKTAKRVSTKTAKRVSKKTAKRVSKKTAKRVSKKTAKRVSTKTAKRVSTKTAKRVSTKTAKRVSSKTAKPVLRKTTKAVARKTAKPVTRKAANAVSVKAARR